MSEVANTVVLRSMVSCVKAGNQLDRPRSAALPKARCWWGSQPRRLELGRLLGAGALLIRLILHGPQGTQGGDLGLGQASDARDSEPLVGPVAAQRTQSMATLEVPEPDRSVIAATGQPAAIGTDLERLHDPLMGFSHPHALTARQVPPAQPTVTASTDEPLPDGMPGDCIDRPRQPLQGGHALPAVRIPHEELPAVLAVTPGGELRAIGAPGHARDASTMPR